MEGSRRVKTCLVVCFFFFFCSFSTYFTNYQLRYTGTVTTTSTYPNRHQNRTTRIARRRDKDGYGLETRLEPMVCFLYIYLHFLLTINYNTIHRCGHHHHDGGTMGYKGTRAPKVCFFFYMFLFSFSFLFHSTNTIYRGFLLQ